MSRQSAAILSGFRRQREVNGTSATYRRGDSLSVTLTVVAGQSEFPRESSEGLVTKVRAQDFLLEAADLVLNAAQKEPEPGDQIEVAGLGTFELAAPGGEEPAWRYSDQHRQILRLHTREIS